MEYDGPSHRAFQEEEKKVQELRESKPLARMIMSAKDHSLDAKSYVFFRGNPESPQNEVTPSELQILLQNRLDGSPRRSLTIGVGSRTRNHLRWIPSFGCTSYRQSYLATSFWVGHRSHPGEFGINGQRPSHPELLDYLSREFMNHGWSLKWLHKQILLSRTFQQASSISNEPERPGDSSRENLANSFARDPENRYWTRMSLRRLEAEAVRDAILAISGQLNPTLGGPSVPIAEDDEGKAVIGSRILRDGLFAGIKDPGDDGKRRSVFLSSKRSMQLNLLSTFDLPEMKPIANSVAYRPSRHRRCSNE